MKNEFVYVLLLVIMITSMLTGAAFAKGSNEKTPQPVSVDVYNHSGCALTVLLKNKNTGGRSYLNIGTRVTTESLAQEQNDYSVTTPCGFENGTWKVTPGRILWISCMNGHPVAVMEKAGSCDISVYWIFYPDKIFTSWKLLQVVEFSSLKDAVSYGPLGA